MPVVELVVAGSLLASAVALVVVGRARTASAALAFAAAALAVPGPAGTPDLVAGLLLGPLALLAYPRPRVREPAGGLALVVVVGSAVLALVVPGALVAAVLVVVLVLVAHTWWALETAPADRAALRWAALGASAAALASGVVLFALDDVGPGAWPLLPLAVVGPALVAGAARRDPVHPRALVVGVITHAGALVGVVAVFVGVAAPVVGGELRGGALAGLGLLAGGLAVVYRPVTRVLRDVAEEVVLGRRRDPVRAVGLVGRHSGSGPGAALEAVRSAVGVPWVALLQDPPLTSGIRPDRVLRVPLDDGAVDLEVGLPPGDSRLPSADRRTLELVAPLLARTAALHAAAEDLQRAREHAVLVREEERRRLRRDLHDGLGPLLAGLAFTADAARNLAATDPPAADLLLREVRVQADAAVADVRRVVEGLRPPALDELGLVPALRQAVAAVRRPDGLPWRVVVDAPVDLVLPAAPEVAVFRIVVEAVVNAARHAGASSVVVTVVRDEQAVHIEVRDDGAGRGVWLPGAGLASMTGRAAELGGALHAGPGPSGGGRVVAVVPVP